MVDPRGMNTEPPAWLTTKQAAALLALHPDTLRRHSREGGGLRGGVRAAVPGTVREFRLE